LEVPCKPMCVTIPDCQAKNTAEEVPPEELGFKWDIRVDPKVVGV